jgi:RNA polymerase sigma factor (sigma-70 family)
METLFRVHSPAVRHVCLGRLKDPVAADDVVQEVFQRAAVNIDKLRENPLPWLLTVTTRLCVSEFRHRERVSGDLELATVQRPDDVARDPADEVVSSLTVDELMSCLTKAERKVVEAKCLDDMTHLEAGRSLGLSSGTTRQLMLRARRRMRAYAEDREIAGLGLLGDTGARLRGWWLRLRERAGGLGRHGTTAERLLAGSLPLIVALTVGVALLPGGDGRLQRRARATSSGTAGPAADGPLRAARPLSAVPRVHALAPSSLATPPLGVQPGVLDNLLAPHTTRPDQISVTDLQASPDYPSDHTIVAAGLDAMCPAGQSCSSLIWSRDGGATWDLMPGTVPLGTQRILLPPRSFSGGQFYAAGTQLYLMSGWGRNSQLVLPAVYGDTGLASTGAGDIVTMSSRSLLGVGGSAPALLGAFPPGDVSAGASAYIPSRDLYLQPVFHGAAALERSRILTCAQTCTGSAFDLGWDLNTHLIAVPGGPVVAWSPAGIATSGDSGVTFSGTAPPAPGANIEYVAMVPHGSGHRLVAAYGTVAMVNRQIAYSDDAGATWATGASPISTGSIGFMVGLDTDRLIMSADLPGAPGRFGFFCSYDAAATWGACVSQ